MRAWSLNQFGIGGLKLENHPSKPLGSIDIRIKILASSLNYRDWLIVNGQYDSRMKLPFVPCSDGVGVVTEIGSKVSQFNLGDRVIPAFSQSWLNGGFTKQSRIETLGGPLDGTLSEEVVVVQAGAVLAPKNLGNEEASTIACAGTTAWNALTRNENLKSGDSILVQGSGGVSIFALQIAKKLGVSVVVVSGSPSRFDKLRELGADYIVDSSKHHAWGKMVREWTGGVGVDHVIEVGGAGTIQQSIAAIRPGGRISLIGMLSGSKQEIDLIPIFMNSIQIDGIYVGSVSMLNDFCRKIEETDLNPFVSAAYEFDEAPKALENLGAGKGFGKLVVKHSQ